MKVLFAHDRGAVGPWREAFARNAPDIDFRVLAEGGNYADADYVITWKPPPGLLAELRSLKAICLLSAGADHLSLDELPPAVDIIRMSEPALVRGMIEYVTFAVQGIHRGLFDCARQAKERLWVRPRMTLPENRNVGVMGLGVIGSAVMLNLKTQGFRMRGWSRSEKSFPGVETFSGLDGLWDFLQATDILVCLLPKTPQTDRLLDMRALECLPKNASVINVARGGIVDETALMSLIDRGHLREAVLDVFETEPLPADHALWSHPKIFVTPHIASVFQPDTAAEAVLDSIRLHASGGSPATLVDRQRGY